MQQVALNGSAACESLYLTQARLLRQLMETLSCKGSAHGNTFLQATPETCGLHCMQPVLLGSTEIRLLVHDDLAQLDQ